jgi:ketosteroid isomerase-like protein
MTPRQIVETWVQLFNAGDSKGLAGLYAEEAINHQVTQEPVVGRAALLDMFEADFERAKMVCQIEAIHEAGDVAILEWSDPLGLRGCGFFTVTDGQIVFQRGYWDKLSFLKMHGLPIE